MIKFEWTVLRNGINSQFIWTSFCFNRNTEDCFSIYTLDFTIWDLVVCMFKWDIQNGTVLKTKVKCVLEKDVRSHFRVDWVVCDLIENTFLHISKIQQRLRRNNVMSLHVVFKGLKEEDRILVFEMSELLLSFLFCLFVHFLFYQIIKMWVNYFNCL